MILYRGSVLRWVPYSAQPVKFAGKVVKRGQKTTVIYTSLIQSPDLSAGIKVKCVPWGSEERGIAT